MVLIWNKTHNEIDNIERAIASTLVQLTKAKTKTVQCNAYFTINAKYYEKIKKNKLNI